MSNSRYSRNQSIAILKSSIQTAITHTTSPTKQLKQCRICLQHQQQYQNQSYITPCKCTGSVKYVHENCIKTWITSSLKNKTRLQQQKIQLQGIPCEMCKHVIKFDMEINIRCNSCNQIDILVKQKKVLLIFVVLLIIISSGGLAFSLYSVATNIEFTNKGQVKFQMILGICGATLLFVFVVLGTYAIIGEFFIKKNLCLGKIMSSMPQKKNNRITQVAPILDQSDMEIEAVNIN